MLDLDTATQGSRIRELVGYMPEHDCLPPDVSATEFVSHMAPRVGAARRRRARAHRRRAAPRRPVRGALPADRRLLDRHEAARQAGPGARPRPAAAVPRRADQRPGPGRPRRDARPDRAHRRASSASPSSSPATCSERSSGSATWLVAIDAGRLLRTAPLATFTERTGQLLRRDRGGRRAAARRAWPRAGSSAGRGPDGRHRPGLGDRTASSGSTTRSATRRSTLGLALVRIEHRRHQLEDLFRDEVPAGADERVA